MNKRCLAAPLCVAVTAWVAWLGASGSGETKGPAPWTPVLPGVFRSPGSPAGYALVEGGKALLIDAPAGADGLSAHGVKKVDMVLLTHHHRDTCAAAARFLAAGVPLRAAKESADWLTPEGVRKYWQESLPLRNSRTAYLVLAKGLAGVDCSLQDSQSIAWQGWSVRVLATPGHSRDHLAFAARKGTTGPWLVFGGDVLATAGKMWSPYTTDWDHWTDAGLTPAAQSLRLLAELKPSALLPAHGPALTADAAGALRQTAEAVEEVAFLKSYERYTKQRLGNAPQYRFLAKEQAGSNGSLPWSQVSTHLFYTGNTWVLVSKDNKAFLVMDPWGKRSADQIARLRKDHGLGALEVVLFSHAHYDHYDGIYELPERERFQVWTLEQVALPIAEPFLLRAPFLDARPVKIDRRPKEGETLSWREYRFRFHHLPGQSEYTMGVETTIDGKRCLFTADNWFHQDLFSGTGGWMGLNRSWPITYAASAQKVLDLAPEWVLAEHGGAFEFNAEDWRRRVQWGKVSAKAAAALCVTGNLLCDWNPHRIRIEPLVQKTKPGAVLKAVLVVDNPLAEKESLTVTLAGHGLTPDQTWKLEVPGRGQTRRELVLRLEKKLPADRHVFPLQVTGTRGQDTSDAFLVADVEP